MSGRGRYPRGKAGKQKATGRPRRSSSSSGSRSSSPQRSARGGRGSNRDEIEMIGRGGYHQPAGRWAGVPSRASRAPRDSPPQSPRGKTTYTDGRGNPVGRGSAGRDDVTGANSFNRQRYEGPDTRMGGTQPIATGPYAVPGGISSNLPNVPTHQPFNASAQPTYGHLGLRPDVPPAAARAPANGNDTPAGYTPGRAGSQPQGGGTGRRRRDSDDDSDSPAEYDNHLDPNFGNRMTDPSQAPTPDRQPTPGERGRPTEPYSGNAAQAGQGNAVVGNRPRSNSANNASRSRSNSAGSSRSRSNSTSSTSSPNGLNPPPPIEPKPGIWGKNPTRNKWFAGGTFFGVATVVTLLGIFLPKDGDDDEVTMMGMMSSNADSTPSASDHTLTGKLTTDRKAKKTTFVPVKDFDLLTLVAKADENDNNAKANIKPASIKLYLNAEDGGAREVTNQGRWKVTAKGKLSFTPDDNFQGGEVSILFTAEDGYGTESNIGTLSVQYGPFTKNGLLENQSLSRKSAAYDVVANTTPASKAKKYEIDATSVELVYRSTENIETRGSRIELQNGSIWEANKTTGEITFKPGANFASDFAFIGFTVRDKSQILSNEGFLTVNFKPKSMGNTKLGFMPNLVVSGKKFELLVSTPWNLSDTNLEISIEESNGFGKNLEIAGEGSWSVKENKTQKKLIFTPATGFRDTPRHIYMRATKVSGQGFETTPVQVALYPIPDAVDDVYTGTYPAKIDVLKNDSVRYMLEPNQLEESTLRFEQLVAMDNNRINGSIASDGKSANVEGEGSWSISGRTVTFSPERGFKDIPTAISYTIEDSIGSRSNPALIILNKHLKDVYAKIKYMIGQGRSSFWKDFKTGLEGKTASDLLMTALVYEDFIIKTLSEKQINLLNNARRFSEDQLQEFLVEWAEDDFENTELIKAIENKGKNISDQIKAMMLGNQATGARSPVVLVIQLQSIIAVCEKYFEL